MTRGGIVPSWWKFCLRPPPARLHTSQAERVRWQQADALALPFHDSSFDAVVCQFGAMFFADKQAAFREALRVLKPGGRFLFKVWDRREEIAI
jgi:ubiquinone/menaquinone biosynthesis C-methylase UbiE